VRRSAVRSHRLGRTGLTGCCEPAPRSRISLDQKTGEILWQNDTGASIYHTAAFAGGRVFVGNEELAAFCLHAESGETLWKKTGMVGMTFMNGCAFVDRGKAVFRTWSAAKATLLQIDKAALDASVGWGEWLSFPEAQERRILANLKEREVDYREMYAYDAETGVEPYVLPHSNGSSVDGPSFGLCSDGRGNWVNYLTVEGWRGHLNLIFARISPGTGRMKDVIWTPDCKLPNSDEANAFSVGGDILFCSEQEEGEAGIFTAFDLKNVKRVPIPTRAHFYSWDFEYNHQPLCNPIAVSGNRFYKVTNHALQCWVGSGQ
jgi:outer membrane protein assembly factor BamB